MTFKLISDHDNEIPLMCKYVLSKLSLVIGSTRLDIVHPNGLAHVVIFELSRIGLINYDHRDD